MINTDEMKTPKWKGPEAMQKAAGQAFSDFRKMLNDGITAEDQGLFHSNRFSTCGHTNLGRIYNAAANAEE